MDPLSISAAILAIIDTTKKVVRYGLDFAGATKEIRLLKASLETLDSLLEKLVTHCENAVKSQPDTEPAWLHGLWEVRSQHFDKNGRWVYEYKGMVAQLKQVIEEMAVKLNPTKEWKKSEAYQRFTWHYKKDTFTEMHTTVTRCCVAINTILALENDEISKKTLELLQEQFEYSTTQLTSIDNRMSIFEKNQKMEEERRRTEDEEREREEIASWLSPLSFIAKQEELWASCLQETGEWLWQDQRFQVWAAGRPWFLQCVGAPGVGKTVLSSILTHRLPNDPLLPRTAVLSIYLNYKSANAQTLPHVVGSLLKQIIQLDELYVISEQLRAVHKKAKRLKLEPISYFDEIHKILLTDLDRFDRFYIVVDGFDELPLRDRRALQIELLKLRPEKGSLVITTRPIGEPVRKGTWECNRCHEKELVLIYQCKICDKGYYDLCYACKEKGRWCLERSHQLTEPYSQVEISVEIPSKDIERYVRWEIGSEIEGGHPLLKDDRDTAVVDNPNSTPFQDLCQSDPHLPDQIITEITKKANGRFLFARLYMDSLKTKSNLRMLRKALRNFPDNTDGIYEEAMQRIQAQEPEERRRAFRILGIVSRARRPLGLKELQHALAVIDFEDDEGNTEMDIEGAIERPKTIIGCTSALVILEEQETQVRLVHRSLEDYLHLEEKSAKWLPNATTDIAKVCMTYLDLVLPRKPCSDEYYVARTTQFPFLQYASQYWGDHIRVATSNPNGAADIQAAALRLINDPQRKDACMHAAWVTNLGGRNTWDVWRNVDKLHICAWYGLSSIVSEMELDYGLVDKMELKYGQTPLMYACRKGHIDTVRQFLLLGASQRISSARGRTPLFEAILGHHTGGSNGASTEPSRHSKVVELLVCEMPQDLDINMVHVQDFNRTALMLAARLGHLEMVEILLRHPGINVDLQDLNGMTALYIAAREDHYEIAQLLLDVKAGIDIADFQAGRTPLRCAAERNLSEMVDLLLRHSADPALEDHEGGTAMLRAVNRGAKEALETMMNYPINLECKDHDGQTLLHGAARNGYHEIARLLMENTAPDDGSQEIKLLKPDVRDNFDLTPLHDASQQGHMAVASVLLENGSNGSLEDYFHRTPFVVAWQYGHDNMMHMLEEAGCGQPSRDDLDEKQLPMWSMARRGLTSLIVQSLKSRTPDLLVLEPYTKNSALHCAVDASEPDILQLLLETKMLPVNQSNYFGRTPLHLAALEGDLLCIKFLIDHGANVDVKDRWQDEPLFLAQSNWHPEAMLVIIEAQAQVKKQKIDTKRLFFFAVEQGNVSSARILIERHGVDRSVQNADGVRALQIATAADDEAMMMLLRESSTVNFRGIAMNDPGMDEPAERKIGFIPLRSRPIQI